MTARVTTPPPPPIGLGRVTAQTVEQPSSSGRTLRPSFPGETSTPCNAPTTGSRRNTPKSHEQLRQNRTRSMAMSNAIFRPRPYEEIYAEQAYLTTSLQVQSTKVADLMRRYSCVEIELETMDPSKQRRRLRKQLNLLRSQINGAAEQEKAIFLRLSELYMEARSRDTLGQVHHQQRASSRERKGRTESSSGTTNTSESPTCAQSSPSTALNGAIPEFVPRSQVVETRASIQAVPKILASTTPSATKSAGPVLETVDESSEDFACNHGLSYQYKTAQKMDEEEGCSQERVPRLGDLRKSRENRLSLPSLESLWPN
ncbi:Uncharacterized protein TPAR_03709 [Tolypocladium paradoxum]|uniref:Uncharacterized protein n=1 Tax=Tolypocladium paradoxum TaxID=94208 RepID=A0A2S4L0Y1_9HYPO|nr:Uncharacterized protein TPAR_03709 [Tolypocladium paradoxum]